MYREALNPESDRDLSDLHPGVVLKACPIADVERVKQVLTTLYRAVAPEIMVVLLFADWLQG